MLVRWGPPRPPSLRFGWGRRAPAGALGLFGRLPRQQRYAGGILNAGCRRAAPSAAPGLAPGSPLRCAAAAAAPPCPPCGRGGRRPSLGAGAPPAALAAARVAPAARAAWPALRCAVAGRLRLPWAAGLCGLPGGRPWPPPPSALRFALAPAGPPSPARACGPGCGRCFLPPLRCGRAPLASLLPPGGVGGVRAGARLWRLSPPAAPRRGAFFFQAGAFVPATWCGSVSKSDQATPGRGASGAGCSWRPQAPPLQALWL